MAGLGGMDLPAAAVPQPTGRGDVQQEGEQQYQQQVQPQGQEQQAAHPGALNAPAAPVGGGGGGADGPPGGAGPAPGGGGGRRPGDQCAMGDPRCDFSFPKTTGRHCVLMYTWSTCINVKDRPT